MATTGVRKLVNGKWLQLLLTSLITINIAATTFVVKELLDLNKRVATINGKISVIEGNRFTSEDGIQLWRALEQKADRSEVPPPEVIRALESIDKRLIRIEDRLTASRQKQ